jgi:hypothetical protein
MPRKTRKHPLRASVSRYNTHKEAVDALVNNPWIALAHEHPAELDGFEPAERKAIMEEAFRIRWARREERLLPILRQRLREWPVYQWADIFGQIPELEEELTPEQRKAWDDFVSKNRKAMGLTK